MTLVSNDPSWWPIISSFRFYSYFAVCGSAMVIYDYVLTLGREIELIWRQRWSLMTVLYLSIRYIGIIYAVTYILQYSPFSVSDAVCNITEIAQNSINVVVAAMLGVIVIARLHAMYQGSRKMLTFLIVIFLAVNIACGVMTVIGFKHVVGVELILSGTYACSYVADENAQLLAVMIWTLNTVWEVLALCLAVWIAIKHFCDLRRLGPSTESTIGDIFTTLIKSHMLYFASFTAVTCLQLSRVSPNSDIMNSNSLGADIYFGVPRILLVVQMFVLGPRLILSVRECSAKLVADSDVGTHMTSIAFQERVHVSTSSAV